MKSIKTFLQSISLVVISTAVTNQVSAQTWSEDANNIWNTSGGKNVGIGTSTPLVPLHVNGSAYINRPSNMQDANGSTTFGGNVYFTPSSLTAETTNGYFYLSYPNNNTVAFISDYDGHIGGGNIRNIAFGSNAGYNLWIDNNNNKVGIGTTNPQAKLHVNGSFQIGNQWLIEYPNNTLGIGHGTNGSGLYLGALAIGYNYGSLGSLVDCSGNAYIVGKVGIGTTTPTEKLEVNGTIKAKKIIATQNGWADYVFDKDYKLMPLKDLSAYVEQHKHLPEIPTTKQIEKEGVDVGTNQALLLKKIEELTLYIIEQQKQIVEQNERIKKLENEKMRQ